VGERIADGAQGFLDLYPGVLPWYFAVKIGLEIGVRTAVHMDTTPLFYYSPLLLLTQVGVDHLLLAHHARGYALKQSVGDPKTICFIS
jgi:hypothetical protein